MTTLLRSSLPANVERVLITGSGTSPITLVSATVGTVIKIWGLEMNVSAATTVNFLSNVTALSGAQSWIDKETRLYQQLLNVPNSSRALPFFQTALDEDFKVTLGTNVTITGWLMYTKEAS